MSVHENDSQTTERSPALSFDIVVEGVDRLAAVARQFGFSMEEAANAMRTLATAGRAGSNAARGSRDVDLHLNGQYWKTVTQSQPRPVERFIALSPYPALSRVRFEDQWSPPKDEGVRVIRIKKRPVEMADMLFERHIEFPVQEWWDQENGLRIYRAEVEDDSVFIDTDGEMKWIE